MTSAHAAAVDAVSDAASGKTQRPHELRCGVPCLDAAFDFPQVSHMPSYSLQASQAVVRGGTAGVAAERLCPDAIEANDEVLLVGLLYRRQQEGIESRLVVGERIARLRNRRGVLPAEVVAIDYVCGLHPELLQVHDVIVL